MEQWAVAEEAAGEGATAMATRDRPWSRCADAVARLARAMQRMRLLHEAAAAGSVEAEAEAEVEQVRLAGAAGESAGRARIPTVG